MMKTLEAVIDVNGNVSLLENIRLPQARRALLTILDDEPQEIKSKVFMSNQELLNALNDAYADDTDDEEKEFLRLAKIKQSQILDEWK
jgi:hypothetical protein